MGTEALQGSRHRRQRLRRRGAHPAPARSSRRRARARRVDRLRRRAALRRCTRTSRGGPTSGSRSSRRPTRPRGMDVVLLGLPHKVSAAQGARDHARRARASSISPATSGCATRRRTRSTTAPTHPCPDELTKGTFVYGLPELNREAIRKAKFVASPGLLRDDHRARAPAARAGGAARGAGRDRRHHRARAAAASRRARARTTRCAR